MQPSFVNRLIKVVDGDRSSSQGKLRLGCSAILFDNERQSILLTRRFDNGQCCLPGGIIDPGESVTEGCEREVFEETEVHVRLIRLTGVYRNTDRLIVYPHGNKVHVIVLNFEVEQIGGELGLSNETTDARFLPLVEVLDMDLFNGHAEHIRDILSGKGAVFIR
jgi:ADP-ribose pyrophosphatase YjhB (NUDIX family)